MSEVFKVAVAGLGTVGSGVVRLLQEQKDVLLKRCGRQIKLTAVSDLNPARMKELNLPEEARQKENAVVLCNEALLVPVLHTLPEEVKDVNITMGFPLAQTPVYSYINALAELQTDGYRADSGRYVYAAVLAVLKHPYVRQLSPEAEALENRLTRDNRFYPLPSELKSDAFLEKVFTPQNDIKSLCAYLTERIKDVAELYRDTPEEEEKDIFGQLYRESLFKSYTLVNRLLGLIDSGELKDIRTETLKRLMNRLLTAANIPFHGEPAIGAAILLEGADNVGVITDVDGKFSLTAPQGGATYHFVSGL